jgi:hypothetical protein
MRKSSVRRMGDGGQRSQMTLRHKQDMLKLDRARGAECALEVVAFGRATDLGRRS